MTLRPHAMTRADAAGIVEALISRWPHPELDPDGLDLEVTAVLDTGLTRDQARLAIRHLLQAAHRWRPTAGQLADIIRPPRRPDFPDQQPGPDWRHNDTIRARNRDELTRTRQLLAKTSRPTTIGSPPDDAA